MDEQRKKAFDFASDSTKQILTLAAGIVALTITFVKDMLNGRPDYIWLLLLSWAIYLISILSGVLTLLALTGSLEPVGSDRSPPSIRGKNVTVPSKCQIWSFLLATALLVAFAILNELKK